MWEKKQEFKKRKGMFFPGDCSSSAELCLARSWAELAFPGPPDWSPGNPKLCAQLGLTPSGNALAAEDLQGPVSHNLTDTEEPMDPRWCPGEAHGSWIVSRKSPSIPDSVWEKPMDHGWCPGGAYGSQKVSGRSLWMPDCARRSPWIPEGFWEEPMDHGWCQEEPESFSCSLVPALGRLWSHGSGYERGNLADPRCWSKINPGWG